MANSRSGQHRNPLRTLAGLVLATRTVAGHGWISSIAIKDETFVGFNPTIAPWVPDQGTIAWPSWNTDTGPVYSSAVSHPDIICSVNATNAAKTSTNVAAGSDITLTWTKWPDSHHGPILTYLAPCHGDCHAANKTELEWFKIDETGQIKLGAGNGTAGYWAADQLIAQNGDWTVHIPSSIKKGNYVLRHEIIALHSAYNVGAAQLYPQCVNLAITGDGTESPVGVVGQKLYSATEAGLHYNIYNDELAPKYTMPGPALYTAPI
ncbi:glycoside hydrolase [Apodospora peruviana]|uniref:lytic cellulose monooxygenase (C4-dehydrogenating) n=1 Tax=Apodospora peruviana TaxID=516989 RepID=A0AAE0ID98_9PEZI|nr:glycoside hydrolase [Apodospora peruviana]